MTKIKENGLRKEIIDRMEGIFNPLRKLIWGGNCGNKILMAILLFEKAIISLFEFKNYTVI